MNDPSPDVLEPESSSQSAKPHNTDHIPVIKQLATDNIILILEPMPVMYRGITAETVSEPHGPCSHYRIPDRVLSIRNRSRSRPEGNLQTRREEGRRSSLEVFLLPFDPLIGR